MKHSIVVFRQTRKSHARTHMLNTTFGIVIVKCNVSYLNNFITICTAASFGLI